MNNIYSLISSSKIQIKINTRIATHPVVVGGLDFIEWVVLRSDELYENQIEVSDDL